MNCSFDSVNRLSALHIGHELFRKPQVLLVPPGLAEMTELPGDRRCFFIEFFIEASEHLSESTEFSRINNGLRHGVTAF